MDESQRKFLDYEGLAHLVGMMQLSVSDSNNAVSSGGPSWLEVDKNGDLYVYYDDNFSEPNIEYDPETGNLYALFDIPEE